MYTAVSARAVWVGWELLRARIVDMKPELWRARNGGFNNLARVRWWVGLLVGVRTKLHVLPPMNMGGIVS